MAFQDEANEIRSVIQALAVPAAICAAGIALFWTLPANARSVSCANADQPFEFAICNSENLQILDEKLG